LGLRDRGALLEARVSCYSRWRWKWKKSSPRSASKGFLEQRLSMGKCKMMFLTDLYHLPFLLDVDLVRTLRFMDLECSLFVLGVVGWS
jgi:hypothetical protein